MSPLNRINNRVEHVGHGVVKRTGVVSTLIVAAASLVLALGAPKARAVMMEPITSGTAAVPPIATLPPATDTAPPADVIGDPIEPAAVCGGWYRQSSYAGVWLTASTWWEYECTLFVDYSPCAQLTAAADGSGLGGFGCDAGWYGWARWTDRFYWNGSQPVFYGENYGYDDTSAICDFWWDAATSQWYPLYDCASFLPPNAPPTPSFTFSCSELTCSFDAGPSSDADGTIQEYYWYFGDETSGSGKAIVHRFAKPGTYTVGLALTDNAGAVSATSEVVNVDGAPITNAAPTARLTVSCSGLSCSFDPTGSGDNDGSIAWYQWEFGDGNRLGLNATIYGGTTVFHTYPEPGSYIVTLTVTDDWCCPPATASDSRTVTVSNAAPTASFTVSCSGLSCSFDGGGSADSDGTVAAYSWSFGDGTSASGRAIDHAYPLPGSYTVTLTVADNAGGTASNSKRLNPISLSARAYKGNGLQKVDLSWSGSNTASFDVYRNGAKIATVSTAAYTDTVDKGAVIYTYKVCERAASTCSNETTVSS